VEQQQDMGGNAFANELMLDNNNYEDENLMDGGNGMLNDYNDEDMLINDVDNDMQDMVQEADDNYFYN
jgi:hypothetical protein